MRGRIVMEIVQIAAARTGDREWQSIGRGRRACRQEAFHRGSTRRRRVRDNDRLHFLGGVLVLMPLADVAAAGFQFISAWSALRSFGQYVQYVQPARRPTAR